MVNRTLEDKVVIIAGGAKNLGGLISRDLASHGAKAIAVHYNSDSTKKEAEDTVKAVKDAGADAIAIQGDLTKVSEITRLFDETIKNFGKPNIAINTAGMVIKKPVSEIIEPDFDKIFAINSKAAFFFIQEAGKKLVDNGNLLTVVTSLLAAYTPFYSVYAGSKAPIEDFTRAASKEFGERGISVNTIGPGPMDTTFFYPAETKESAAYHATAAALSKSTKSGLTEIQDIAPLVRFLVTDGWWVTGQTIFANGGYTTR